MKGSSFLSEEQYQAIARYLERCAGIRLGAGKEYLVVSRLRGVLQRYGLASFDALVQALQAGGNRAVQAAVVDAMTTNETFWFRDAAHYGILVEQLLPACIGRTARIWSAAASTGQEAYSIIFAIQEAVLSGRLPRGFDYQILGTDISPSALAQAEAARYCGLAGVRGLTQEQRQRFFVDDGDCIEVQAAYRKQVRFRPFNLLDTFDHLGRFDVIFCRNVLIYFSQARKRDILERFHRALHPGGALFLGSSESMSEHADLFEMERYGTGLVYRRC